MTNKFYIKCLEKLNEIMENAEKEYDLQKTIGDIALRSTSILSWYEGQAMGIIYSISTLGIPHINIEDLYAKYVHKISKMSWSVITEK